MTRPADRPALDLRALTQTAELIDVGIQSCSAERFAEADGGDFDLVIESGVAVGDDRLDYRFDATVEVKDEDDEPVATIRTAVLVTFALAEPVPVAEEVAAAFGNRVAFLTAYPYLRESVQSLAARVGLPTVVLGLVRAGQDGPRRVTVGGATANA